MNYSRKKIALLMGTLIIGQVMTMQNAHGMDPFGDNNTEENAAMIYDFWTGHLFKLYNKMTTLYNTAGNVVGNITHKVDEYSVIITNKANEYGPIIKAELQQKTNAVKDEYTELYNATAQQNQYRTKPGFRLIPGIGAVDALNDGVKAIYNYDYATLYNNASTQGNALYNQASDIKTRTHNGVANVYNNVSTWCTDDAPHFLSNVREGFNKDFWTRALPIVQNDAIQYQNNATQYIEDVKNLPNAIEIAVKDKVKNEVADTFNVDKNAPIDANVIVDAVAKKAIISLTKYATLVAAGLFTTYKTYTYCANKYQEYQKEVALNESIKQHLTDAKKAEIAALTGKELSEDDVQEIINTVKTHATTAEDSRVTEEIIDLVVKEYVAKHINA